MKQFIRGLLFPMLGFIIGFILFFHGPVGLLKVTSGSMEPFLEIGDICVIDKKAEYDDLRIGEVAVFYYGDGSLACHRIVTKTDGGFVTKGDANEYSDIFLMTENNFYGKLIIAI